MARNQGQEYAEMEDDERRRFALGGHDPGLQEDQVTELDFEPDPRDADHMGTRPPDPLMEQAEAGAGSLIEEAERRQGQDGKGAKAPRPGGTKRRRTGG